MTRHPSPRSPCRRPWSIIIKLSMNKVKVKHNEGQGQELLRSMSSVIKGKVKNNEGQSQASLRSRYSSLLCNQTLPKSNLSFVPNL